jgi:hypothetical protein
MMVLLSSSDAISSRSVANLQHHTAIRIMFLDIPTNNSNHRIYKFWLGSLTIKLNNVQFAKQVSRAPSTDVPFFWVKKITLFTYISQNDMEVRPATKQ